jgi:hypothetical protein
MPLLPLPAVFPFAGGTIAKAERSIPPQETNLRSPWVSKVRQAFAADICQDACLDKPQVAARSLPSAGRSSCTLRRVQLYLVEFLRNPSGPKARLEPVKPLVEYSAFLFVANPEIEVACPEIDVVPHSVVNDRS